MHQCTRMNYTVVRRICIHNFKFTWAKKQLTAKSFVVTLCSSFTFLISLLKATVSCCWYSCTSVYKEWLAGDHIHRTMYTITFRAKLWWWEGIAVWYIGAKQSSAITEAGNWQNWISSAYFMKNERLLCYSIFHSKRKISWEDRGT